MDKAHGEQRGAIGLATEDGGKEMIDAPMLKQVRRIYSRVVRDTDILDTQG